MSNSNQCLTVIKLLGKVNEWSMCTACKLVAVSCSRNVLRLKCLLCICQLQWDEDEWLIKYQECWLHFNNLWMMNSRLCQERQEGKWQWLWCWKVTKCIFKSDNNLQRVGKLGFMVCGYFYHVHLAHMFKVVFRVLKQNIFPLLFKYIFHSDWNNLPTDEKYVHFNLINENIFSLGFKYISHSDRLFNIYTQALFIYQI